MWMLYIFKFDRPSGYSGDDYVTYVEPRITFYETYDEAKNEIYKLALKHYESLGSKSKDKYFKKYKPKVGMIKYTWDYSYKLYIYECVSGNSIDFDHSL